MAITNAQQARQLYIKGGQVFSDGRRGFAGGAGQGDSDKGYQGGGRDKSGSVSGEAPGAGSKSDRSNTPSGADDRSSDRQTYNTKKATGTLGRQDANQMDSTIFYGPKGETIDIGFQGDLNDRETRGQTFLETEPKYNKYVPAYLKTLANFNNTPNRKFFYENVIRGGKIPGLGYDEEDFEEEYEKYMDNRMAGKTDAYGNPTQGFEYGDNNMLTGNFMDNGGGDNNYVPPIIPDDNDDTEEEEVVPNRNLGGLAARFAGSEFDFDGMADGGRAGAMDGGRMMMMANEEEDDTTGGIMDLESGRQMYFLGKLVKKATRAVKKIAKSPVGKAALMYFGGKTLMGGGGGKGLSSFFGKKSFNPFLQMMGKEEGLGPSPFGDLMGKLGLFDTTKLKMTGLGKTAAIGLPSIIAGLTTPKDEDDSNLDNYYASNTIDYNNVRNKPYKFLSAANQGSRFNVADGGIMRNGYAEGSEEPVAKKTMPLLDMDGQEMDLREEGGFVPLGRMERADDVPARLSKNEFVFTADAVRNAGEGDVDKGAEVMYNMMKNLESGGDVSEESQGLEGAREMFQTSQRLEEVI